MNVFVNVITTAVMLIGLPVILFLAVAHALLTVLLAFVRQVVEVWE